MPVGRVRKTVVIFFRIVTGFLNVGYYRCKTLYSNEINHNQCDRTIIKSYQQSHHNKYFVPKYSYF